MTLSFHQQFLQLTTAARRSFTVVVMAPVFLKFGAAMVTKTVKTVVMNLPVREPRECVTPRQSLPAKSQVEISKSHYHITTLRNQVSFVGKFSVTSSLGEDGRKYNH